MHLSMTCAINNWSCSSHRMLWSWFQQLLLWLLPTCSCKLWVWWELLLQGRLLWWYTADMPTRWRHCTNVC